MFRQSHDLGLDVGVGNNLRSIWSDYSSDQCSRSSSLASNSLSSMISLPRMFAGGYDTGSGLFLPTLNQSSLLSRDSAWTSSLSSSLQNSLSGGSMSLSSEASNPRMDSSSDYEAIISKAISQALYMKDKESIGRSSPRRLSLADRVSPVNSLSSMLPTPYEAALERIEKEAKMRRSNAYLSEASVVWNGILPTQTHKVPTYATKVFVGGLPYDVTMETLQDVFGQFGLTGVQFPPRGRGHAYLVFDSEEHVKHLLDACECTTPGQFYYWVTSRRGKDRKAQVIPWVIEDSDWLAEDESLQTRERHDRKQNTVFVGALHGEITAEGLQAILGELFGPVVHVGIDTDKNRYPNGSARVTFVNRCSFNRAVSAEFVDVITPRFSKTIQLDAYIEDGMCSMCHKLPTPVFCRHPNCFTYYCPCCFEEHRRFPGDYHPPVMRNRNLKN